MRLGMQGNRRFVATMSRSLRLRAVSCALLSAAASFGESRFLQTYKGTPYHDSRWTGSPQVIPGRVQCAYFDAGGEGISYHDSDAKNHGSGELNPRDGSYLNEFRWSEGVDTSYTK